MRAVVCGASKGIGRATAEMMVACARCHCTESKRARDSGCRSISLNLEDAAAIEKTISGILVAGPIHILVNNAAGPPGGPLLDNDVADFEAPFKDIFTQPTKLRGMVVPAMEEAGTGRIVNIISNSSANQFPISGYPTLCVAAPRAKSLSRELPRALPSTTSCQALPTRIDWGHWRHPLKKKTGRSQEDIHNTWMSQVPIGRLIDPTETASAITFLFPQSGGIRGVSLAVDGGRMRSI